MPISLASLHLRWRRQEAHAAGHFAELVGLAAPSVVIFFLLGLIKLQIGYATASPSMKKDGACSLCGAPW